MRVIIQSDSRIIELPILTVNSVSEIKKDLTDEEVTTINGKPLNIIAGTGLTKFTISSFFPSKYYNFAGLKVPHSPTFFINFFNSIMEKKKPVKIIIVEGFNIVLNIECRIAFSYQIADKAGDVPYTLEITEWVNPDISGKGFVYDFL